MNPVIGLRGEGGREQGEGEIDLGMHLFSELCEARVSKLWLIDQIWLVACFYMTCDPKIVSICLNKNSGKTNNLWYVKITGN